MSIRFARTSLTVLALPLILAACGGGGGNAGTASVAQDNQLILIEAGDSQVAAGTYALDTTYNNSAYANAITTGTLETVFPEHEAFDTGLSFMQNNTQKYLVGFWSGKVDKGYSCRSAAWTSAELAEVAVVLDDDTIPSAPICTSTVTVNAAQHSASYTNLRLPLDSNGSTSVVVSAKFNWPAPKTGISGSGSSSTGSASSSTGTASAGTAAP